MGFAGVVHPAFIANQLIGGNALLTPSCVQPICWRHDAKSCERLSCCLLLTAAVTYQSFNSARAEDCPSNADALGTSRVLIIDPNEYPHVGAMDHAAALPLSDKEVVITFDDGPVPRYTNQILDILAAQCVKATFFHCG